MKITGNSGISVNISSGKELGSILKNLNPGDLITASVIRSEGNKAVLEIMGRSIVAEFTNGVPREKTIDLVLTSRTPEMIQFALKDSDPSDRILKFLSPFSLKSDDISNSALHNFARFVNSARPDLFEINLFLQGLRKEEGKEKTLTSIFNRLLQKGVPFQTLADISYILYSKYNPLLFMSYQHMMNFTGKKSFIFAKEKQNEVESAIGNFCDILKDDDADFSLMLDLIFDDHKDGEIYGELAFPDEENFSGIKYILKEDSVFLKFDLSAAGELGVLVKSGKELTVINFLSVKDDVLFFIKECESLLKKMLEQNGVKKSAIGYFNSKKIVDKIELWSLDFYTKSGFNVKV